MDYPVHCIIRAGGSDGYAFIDLTAGQLWVSGIDVPLSLVQFSEMWSLPTFRLNGGGSVRYLPCPYEDKVDRSLFNQPRPNFVDDVTDLIHIAVDCDFDLERVESVISEQFPDDHAFTQSRLRSFRLPLK